jgi:drug/metabolite transporter (DMT)-like permease
VVGPPLIFAVGIATVLVLGLNWPIMTWGLETIAPLWLTSLRLLGAGGLLAMVLALSGGLRRPPREDYPVIASVAVIRLALVYGLVFSALLLVPPGRSSMLVHTSGLWAAPIGAWLLHEHLSTGKVAGLLVGVAGILLLMEPWGLQAGSEAALGYGMLIAAAAATALANVHVRGHRWRSTPLMLMPWQLIAAGLLTTPIALALHGPPQLAGTLEEVLVVGYQVVLASGFGVWGILTLSRSLSAVSSGAVFMAVPAIGVASSVLLVGEVLTPAAIGGIALVFAGVWTAIASDGGRQGDRDAAA